MHHHIYSDNCCFASTEISVSNLFNEMTFLNVKRSESSTVAVCVHGGELTLSHIWGSVKVVLKFHKTEVQFFEAERLVHFMFCISLYFILGLRVSLM